MNHPFTLINKHLRNRSRLSSFSGTSLVPIPLSQFVNFAHCFCPFKPWPNFKLNARNIQVEQYDEANQNLLYTWYSEQDPFWHFIPVWPDLNIILLHFLSFDYWLFSYQGFKISAGKVTMHPSKFQPFNCLNFYFASEQGWVFFFIGNV